jgi:hypothetical protein
MCIEIHYPQIKSQLSSCIDLPVNLFILTAAHVGDTGTGQALLLRTKQAINRVIVATIDP